MEKKARTKLEYICFIIVVIVLLILYVVIKLSIGNKKDLNSNIIDNVDVEETLNDKDEYTEYLENLEKNDTTQGRGSYIPEYSVGSITTFGTENFYYIGSDEDENGLILKFLAQYGLEVGQTGNIYCYPSHDCDITDKKYIENPSGIQSSKTVNNNTQYPINYYGGTIFSNNSYWLDGTYLKEQYTKNSYQSKWGTYYYYVYDENSIIYGYIENYVKYLNDNRPSDADYYFTGRPIKFEELESLGYDQRTSCKSTYSWLCSPYYWTGDTLGMLNMKDDEIIGIVGIKGIYEAGTGFVENNEYTEIMTTIRPVIEMHKK